MNLSTVAANLRNTIAGKEKMLADLRYQSTLMARAEEIVAKATIKFLEINIDELKKILADVEQCVEKDVEQSWRESPDRMGGQFTQDEIYNMNRSGWIEP